MANNEVKITGENLNQEPTTNEAVNEGTRHAFGTRLLCTVVLTTLAATTAMGIGCDTNVDDDDAGDDDIDNPDVDNTPPGAPSMDATGTMDVPENTTVPITGDVPNPEDTETVQYRLNGGSWETVESYQAGDGEFGFDVEVGTADVTVEVQAVDKAGNESGPGDDLKLNPEDVTPPENPTVNPHQVEVTPDANEFEVSVSVDTDTTKVKIYDNDGDLVDTIVVPQGSTDFQLTVDHDPGTEGSYTFATVDAAGNESEGTAVPVNVVEPPNAPPEIDSLVVDPDPVEIFGEAEVVFAASDADGDGMVYDLNLTNGNGAALSNPSHGTCDTATHCSGTIASGDTVIVDMETADEANATVSLEVDDGNGGEDYTEEGVGIN